MITVAKPSFALDVQLSKQSVNVYEHDEQSGLERLTTTVELDVHVIGYEPVVHLPGAALIVGQVRFEGEDRFVGLLLQTNLKGPIAEESAEGIGLAVCITKPTWRLAP